MLLELAYSYYYIGWFEESEKIANDLLVKKPNDIENLSLKMNIEMAKGNYEGMKVYEKKVLKISPTAFDKN